MIGRRGLRGGAAAVLLVLAGCGVNGAETGGEIRGVLWRWVAETGAEPMQVDRPGRYTLELREDGRYHARADCNQANGSYTLEGDRLRLGPAATTMAACPPDSFCMLDFLAWVLRPAYRDPNVLSKKCKGGSATIGRR